MSLFQPLSLLGLTQRAKRGKKEEELGKTKCQRNLAP
jgi:hypothetical protein